MPYQVVFWLRQERDVEQHLGVLVGLSVAPPTRVQGDMSAYVGRIQPSGYASQPGDDRDGDQRELGDRVEGAAAAVNRVRLASSSTRGYIRARPGTNRLLGWLRSCRTIWHDVA
jgi:hypothetical protein